MNADDLRSVLAEFDDDVEVLVRLPSEKFRVLRFHEVEEMVHGGKTVAVLYDTVYV